MGEDKKKQKERKKLMKTERFVCGDWARLARYEGEKKKMELMSLTTYIMHKGPHFGKAREDF